MLGTRERGVGAVEWKTYMYELQEQIGKIGRETR